MRRIIFLGCSFAAAMLMGGLPLISEHNQQPIPNYQILEDGSLTQLQQTGNTLLSLWAESAVHYDQSQLNELEREQRGQNIRP
jgi:hypothetical protein